MLCVHFLLVDYYRWIILFPLSFIWTHRTLILRTSVLARQWNRDNAMFNKEYLVQFQVVYIKQFLLAWLTTWLKDRLVYVNCRTITFPLYIIYIAEIVRKLVSSIPVSCRNRSYFMQIECENKMLKWYLFCPKREEVTGGWIKLNALFVSC